MLPNLVEQFALLRANPILASLQVVAKETLRFANELPATTAEREEAREALILSSKELSRCVNATEECLKLLVADHKRFLATISDEAKKMVEEREG